jgi:hypothetical protein
MTKPKYINSKIFETTRKSSLILIRKETSQKKSSGFSSIKTTEKKVSKDNIQIVKLCVFEKICPKKITDKAIFDIVGKSNLSRIL